MRMTLFAFGSSSCFIVLTQFLIALLNVPYKCSQTKHLGILVYSLECLQKFVNNGIVYHCDDA